MVTTKQKLIIDSQKRKRKKSKYLAMEDCQYTKEGSKIGKKE